ncbi:hypothetical protein EVAR_27635_1 [Eumeta japonica]|uniref:Uncharacterized protein n=1 Tax=Eumeta variegata TaxID=151549 RepID=A0A4C1V0E9_EUMVA|nr:hypothetical protein EVAR_27635_1 [Eumeta japonica]
MNTRNPRGVTSAFPALWEKIRYPIEGKWATGTLSTGSNISVLNKKVPEVFGASAAGRPRGAAAPRPPPATPTSSP